MSGSVDVTEQHTYLDTFTYDNRGRIKSHSRVSNGRTTRTVNQFDQLDQWANPALRQLVAAASTYLPKLK